MDILTAVNKLNSQLPLKQRQNQLPRQYKSVHQAMMHALVEQGRLLTNDEIKQFIENDNTDTCVQTLAEEDLIVLDNKRKPVGAYPVTVEQTLHKINVNGHTIYAMCALDAVSVAPLFDADVKIESGCHVTLTPLSIHMQGSNILDAKPPTNITVGIRWQMPSAVAAHSMCMEMVFLKDRNSAVSWQGADPENISLFTLPEAVEFGSGFFLPLLN